MNCNLVCGGYYAFIFNMIIYAFIFKFSGVAFRGLPNTLLYPAVSAVYGKTEVSMVYLGPPLDG